MHCRVPCGIQPALPACSALLALKGEDAAGAKVVQWGDVGMV